MVSRVSFLVVVFCATMTSSLMLQSHGNRPDFHSDHSFDVTKKVATAPPIGDKTTKIDYNEQTSNEVICHELCKQGDGGNACLCDWAPMERSILIGIKLHRLEKLISQLIYPTPENNPNCKILCRNGEEGHFCLCY